MYRLRWDDIVYEPGELRVVAYKNGQKWAEDMQRTAGPAAVLDLSPDRDSLSADGRDLAYFSVAVRDSGGTLVPRASNTVRFTLDGPGSIVATDNGDPTSFESFQLPQRRLFNGRALVIVRSRRGEPGKITLRAESDGLVSSVCSVDSVAASDDSPSEDVK